ncbi:hypothetical protein CHGG_08212 [Chaetomium globosum CBS 148.51]|uniref:PPM-type phosphatase domain-containing protein n=1 Tax=Chaetomium globosum (strain ATCC 6205 / CBS 148.51 / DSM 1962 / NBRC 6347 / NRRL 1970) TaxID=306901 RepID=Q2GUZ2_CHAGB|nr:uncharacterized protein CHGG_08212 [Chaetomium globosum CBS 148.51]EAQ86959.1 hypothetical protein CHGG_08212 [Chaetomium globosum CBS 148.51]
MSACALRAARSRRPLRAPAPAPAQTSATPLRVMTDFRGQHSQPLISHSFKRGFHNYFVTHLPSSSLHPDSRSSAGPGHKLPRSASTPHTPAPGSAPAVAPPNMPSRDLTVVRIPLRSAKHHFGVSESRGQRCYNEDTNQAGTIRIPAFAKRVPVSLVRHQAAKTAGEGTSADSALGDPQIFYFGVFDGHGGSECSQFLREELHGYIEEAAAEFGLESSLKRDPGAPDSMRDPETIFGQRDPAPQFPGETQGQSQDATADAGLEGLRLQSSLLAEYKRTIGGYFRRFRPNYFTAPMAPSMRDPSSSSLSDPPSSLSDPATHTSQQLSQPSLPSLESVLIYAFLRADLDFVTAQARKPDPDDPYISDIPLNEDEILGSPHLPPSGHGIGGPARFKGGRAFGDMQSKRIGVSAEPDVVRVALRPAEFAFLVLVSDGVSGSLGDQEIVDVVKEAATPEEGARKVVEYATEVSADGDNATCLVVRLGGWERRSEGGVGSLGTREVREMRRAEAADPRRRGR